MITTEERQTAIMLIDEATTAGARQAKACNILEIDERTLRRWKKQQTDEGKLNDRRQEAAIKHQPGNKLTEEERVRIIEVCNQPEHQSLPPSQIVPKLADEGEYIASESSFYRVLRDAKQVNRRGRTEPPKNVAKPKGYQAEKPNQVWSWDITYRAPNL